MPYDVWSDILHKLKAAYLRHPKLIQFSEFPNDLEAMPVTPFHTNSSRLLQSETGLRTSDYAALRDALIKATPFAQWREPYKGTSIGQDFMDRFGNYNIIGEGGAFQSRQLWAWVVYMPPNLHYPWHHHPAEEIYLVLAGEAEFMKAGEPNMQLGPGDTSFHASNQPHAMETGDHPVMCLVVWRNDFDVEPVLTEGLE